MTTVNEQSEKRRRPDRPAAAQPAGLEQFAKDRLPAGRIWTATDKPLLRLITCGDRFNRATRHYDDNIIVYPSPR